MCADSPKSRGLWDFEDKGPETFWTDKCATIPSHIDFESESFIRLHKEEEETFLPIRLAFSSSTIFLSKEKNKFKFLNLKQVFCKLYAAVIGSSGYPYVLALRLQNKGVDLYFEDKALFMQWVFKLRNFCVMNDFTSLYAINNKVSMGSHSAFFVEERKSGELYMAQVYNLRTGMETGDSLKHKIEKQIIYNQISALRIVDHPNVLKLKEVHELEERIVLLTEIVSGSSLLRHILSKGSLPEKETIYILKILLNTLKTLHNAKILHRNIKPENIYLNYTSRGTEIKLTDFRFSCTLDENNQSIWHSSRNICSKCGTPGYMAPEVLTNKPHTTASDIFSLGVILYTSLTGEALFKGKSVRDIIYKNLEVNFNKTSLKWNLLSENARDLIVKMTRVNPSARPSIDEILHHPFFTSQTKILSYSNNLEVSKEHTIPKNSIDDSIFIKEPTPKESVTMALRSLIVPPSYLNVNETNALEVPEFYIDANDTQKNLVFKETLGSSQLPGSYTDSGKPDSIKEKMTENLATPRFQFHLTILELDNAKLDLIEEESESDVDEHLLAKNHKECYKFPRLCTSPFISTTHSFEIVPASRAFTDGYVYSATMDTARKLPHISKKVRGDLENKSQILTNLAKISGLN